MNPTILAIATLVFFGATAAKDGGFFPEWLRIARLISAVILALSAAIVLIS